MGGRGASGASNAKTKTQSKPLYTTDKKGVRTYEKTPDAQKEFNALSESSVHWNKGAYISKTTSELGMQVKRSQIAEYLKKRDINSFVLTVPKGDEKRAISYFSDYGWNVVAKSGYNENAKSKADSTFYYLSKKEMLYLGHDLKIKKYYKRGWKG